MQPMAADPTLAAIQQYVADMEVERGFSGRGIINQALLLGEEVGELFKAIRKHEQVATATGSIVGTIDEELADILIYVAAIANRLNIDLADALRRKEVLNETRTWA